MAAAQKDRFTSKKGDAAFPKHAIHYRLQTTGLRPSDLAYVGFYDKPLLKSEHILETYLWCGTARVLPVPHRRPAVDEGKRFIEQEIRRTLGYDGEILYAEHHESHAASAFFPSPFEEATVLTVDGLGYGPRRRSESAVATTLSP